MKKSTLITVMITVLGLIGTVWALAVLPDTIPVHYNFAGEADRMGSKYEMLIFPVLAVVYVGIFRLLDRFVRNAPDSALQQKIFAVTSAAGEALFFGLGFWFMHLAGRQTPSAPAVDAKLLCRGIGVLVGAILVLLGNYMPKARRNALFGLRVPWTMNSDAVWQRSQRFCGITAVMAGAAVIVLSFLLPGMWGMAGIIGVPLVWVMVSLAVSWRYSREQPGARLTHEKVSKR